MFNAFLHTHVLSNTHVQYSNYTTQNLTITQPYYDNDHRTQGKFLASKDNLFIHTSREQGAATDRTDLKQRAVMLLKR
jgi:hypothetical protein